MAQKDAKALKKVMFEHKSFHLNIALALQKSFIEKSPILEKSNSHQFEIRNLDLRLFSGGCVLHPLIHTLQKSTLPQDIEKKKSGVKNSASS